MQFLPCRPCHFGQKGHIGDFSLCDTQHVVCNCFHSVCFLLHIVPVVDVVWESTYVFFAAFLLLGSSHEQPHLVHVIAQKGKEPVYTDLEDACFGGGEGRSARYYSALLPQWNMLLLASATSLEAAVLGKSQADEVGVIYTQTHLQSYRHCLHVLSIYFH